MNTSMNTSVNRAGITLESVSDGLADITTLYCAEVAKIENIGDHISISLEGVDLDQFVSELTPQQKSYVLDAIGAADIAAWWDENEEAKDE